MHEYLLVAAADREREKNIGYQITMFGIPDLLVVRPDGLDPLIYYRYLKSVDQAPFAAYVSVMEWGNIAKTEEAIVKIKEVFPDIKIAHGSISREHIEGVDEYFGVGEDEARRLKECLNKWRSEAALSKRKDS